MAFNHGRSILTLLISSLGWLLFGATLVGSVYTLTTAIVLRRFMARGGPVAVRDEAVTVLKPLYGDEPQLFENLSTFLRQRHRGPVQLLCGVQRRDDPAIVQVERLRAAFPDAWIDLVVDSALHGSNGKLSNLVNMARHVAYPTLVLSDSDMVVPADYLVRVLGALDSPGVGAVTCLYRGRGDTGLWSRIGAAHSSYQFLPGVVFAAATGLARPCMGSTIALRRETLAAIGGFTAFADILADDHAIGAAIEALGLSVAIPPMLLVHAADEPDLASLWQHELRWAVTVRRLAVAGYIGSVVGMPLPLALLALLFHPGWLAMAATAFALIARFVVAAAVDRVAGAPTASRWLLPLRDVLAFAVYGASFLTRSVEWRGRRLTLAQAGRITTDTEA